MGSTGDNFTRFLWIIVFGNRWDPGMCIFKKQLCGHMLARAKDNMTYILPCRGKPPSGKELCLTRVLIPTNILLGMILSFLFICILKKPYTSFPTHLINGRNSRSHILQPIVSIYHLFPTTWTGSEVWKTSRAFDLRFFLKKKKKKTYKYLTQKI